ARQELAVEQRELDDARGDRPDDAIETLLFERSVAATEARKAFEEARERFLEMRPDDLRAALVAARDELDGAVTTLESLRRRRIELGARIEALGEQGLHRL